MADLLTIKEVIAKTKIPRATLYRYRDAGTFPDPVRVGARNVFWRSDAIDEWLRAQRG